MWSYSRKKVPVFKCCANSLFLLCTFRKSLKQKRKALSRKFILNRLHYSHFTPTFLFRVAKDFYWVSVLRFEAALSSCVNISGQRPYRALPSAACTSGHPSPQPLSLSCLSRPHFVKVSPCPRLIVALHYDKNNEINLIYAVDFFISLYFRRIPYSWNS